MTATTAAGPAPLTRPHPLPRILALSIAVASLVALAAVAWILAIGGRPDPADARASVPLLGGAWKFHVGDDARWAAPNFDDRGWETIDLTAPAGSSDGDVGLPNYGKGWMAHGHPGYLGYAWYRRAVSIPAGERAWDILGPTAVDDGYELYWNGVKLGGSGRIGSNPRVVGVRPMLFPLPVDAAGKTGVLAIRAYMPPNLHSGAGDGGGVHVAPSLGPRPQSLALYRAEWQRTIAGYVVELVEPLAMLALIGMALAVRKRSSRRDFIALACIALVFSGLKRLDNAIVAWTDLMSLNAYVWLPRVLWTPLGLTAWALAWNHWPRRAWRAVDLAALALGLIGVVGGALKSQPMMQTCRFGMLALFALTAVRIARAGPMRAMALAAMALMLTAQYPGELGSLGVQGIWFPFGIGVTLAQYAYAIGIPLLALLIVRTLNDERGSAPGSAPSPTA